MAEMSESDGSQNGPDYEALWEEAGGDIARYADLIEQRISTGGDYIAASVEATRQTLDELAEDWPVEPMTRAEAQDFIRNQPVVPPPSPTPPAATEEAR